MGAMPSPGGLQTLIFIEILKIFGKILTIFENFLSKENNLIFFRFKILNLEKIRATDEVFLQK